jgi:predicted RNA-binding protein YlxR (DUF448 family)
MARGGRPKERDGPERRCLASGVSGDPGKMIRFVVGPDGNVVPDLAEKLPGRGAWVTATRSALAKVFKKRAFNRSFKDSVQISSDLADHVEALLARRLIALISLSRKAGNAVCGFEKTRFALPGAAVLLQASDGAADGRTKMRRLAEEIPTISLLRAEELGLAFGREYVIHAALSAGRLTTLIERDATRLYGFRDGALGDPG